MKTKETAKRKTRKTVGKKKAVEKKNVAPLEGKEAEKASKKAGAAQAELLLSATEVACGCGSANCAAKKMATDEAEAAEMTADEPLKAISRNRLGSLRLRLRGAPRNLAYQLYKKDEQGPTSYSMECATKIAKALGVVNFGWLFLDYTFVLEKFNERKAREKEDAERARKEREAAEKKTTEEIAAKRTATEEAREERETCATELLAEMNAPEEAARQAKREEREALEAEQREWLKRLLHGELSGCSAAIDMADARYVIWPQVDERTVFGCQVPGCDSSGAMAAITRKGSLRMCNIRVPLNLVRPDGSVIIDDRDRNRGQACKDKDIVICSYHAWMAKEVGGRRDDGRFYFLTHPIARTYKRYLEREREREENTCVASASTTGPTVIDKKFTQQ